MPQLTAPIKPQPASRRYLGHLRRNVVAYAALLGVLALSPVPSMAADLVTTGDIANGAVTQPKLAADSVVGGKIANESVTGLDIKNGTVAGADIKDGTIGAADVAPLQWNNFVLLNGWTNANGALRPPAWAIDGRGIIYLRGAVTGGANPPIGRLPATVRPSTYVYVSTTLDGSQPGQIVINPDGYVQADYNGVLGGFGDAIAFTTLDGVTWAK